VGSKERSSRPGAVRGQPVRNRRLKKEPIFSRTEGPSCSLSFRNPTVMKYAEENLSQILPHWPLTPAEGREMLEPVLDVLVYVHGQGFVHGHIFAPTMLPVRTPAVTTAPRGTLSSLQQCLN
jgi:hypothetical protein